MLFQVNVLIIKQRRNVKKDGLTCMAECGYSGNVKMCVKLCKIINLNLALLNYT